MKIITLDIGTKNIGLFSTERKNKNKILKIIKVDNLKKIINKIFSKIHKIKKNKIILLIGDPLKNKKKFINKIKILINLLLSRITKNNYKRRIIIKKENEYLTTKKSIKIKEKINIHKKSSILITKNFLKIK